MKRQAGMKATTGIRQSRDSHTTNEVFLFCNDVTLDPGRITRPCRRLHTQILHVYHKADNSSAVATRETWGPTGYIYLYTCGSSAQPVKWALTAMTILVEHRFAFFVILQCTWTITEILLVTAC